jgi:hypothetical protein
MRNAIEDVKNLMRMTIEDCVRQCLYRYHTATGEFPRTINVTLGELVHVNNVEAPKVTVTIA